MELHHCTWARAASWASLYTLSLYMLAPFELRSEVSVVPKQSMVTVDSLTEHTSSIFHYVFKKSGTVFYLLNKPLSYWNCSDCMVLRKSTSNNLKAYLNYSSRRPAKSYFRAECQVPRSHLQQSSTLCMVNYTSTSVEGGNPKQASPSPTLLKFLPASYEAAWPNS